MRKAEIEGVECYQIPQEQVIEVLQQLQIHHKNVTIMSTEMSPIVQSKLRLYRKGVDMHNIGVVKGSKGFGFAFEARHNVGLCTEIIAKDFKSYRTAQSQIGGAIYHTHAATASGILDFVIAEDVPLLCIAFEVLHN